MDATDPDSGREKREPRPFDDEEGAETAVVFAKDGHRWSCIWAGSREEEPRVAVVVFGGWAPIERSKSKRDDGGGKRGGGGCCFGW